MVKPTLIIMVKEPIVGRVKTRLGREIGMAQAAQWYRQQVRSLIRGLYPDPRWQTLLAVTPNRPNNLHWWPHSCQMVPQGTGDLGKRMFRLLNNAPKGPVLLIGSDIPQILRADLHFAFAQLKKTDMVFGPAADGGFWLVGVNRTSRPLPQVLFENVQWSQPTTLEETLEPLEPGKVSFCKTLTDVDSQADLKGLLKPTS